MNSSALRLGEVALRWGVTLTPYAITNGGGSYRPPRARKEASQLLAPEMMGLVQFIKQAHELGFSHDEIAQPLATGGTAECGRMRDLLRAKLAEPDERMGLMREFRRTLYEHLSACEKELNGRGKAAQCPVVVKIAHMTQGVDCIHQPA